MSNNNEEENHLSTQENEIYPFIQTIKSSISSDREKIYAYRSLREYMSSESHVIACLKHDIVSLVYSTVEDVDDLLCKEWALSALSEAAFYHHVICPVIVQHPSFSSIFLNIFQRSEHPEYLKDTALVCITSVISSSPELHSIIRLLIPTVSDLFYSATTRVLKADCVRFFNNLSVFEENRPHIIFMIGSLLEIMGTGDIELASISACCAVSNLIGATTSITISSKTYSTESILTSYQMTVALEQLILAFEATLQGSDFPVGSGVYYQDWKICMSLSNICRLQACKETLIKANIFPLLNMALLRYSSDEQSEDIVFQKKDSHILRRYALHTLWNLTDNSSK